MTDELKPVNCGCGGEVLAFMTLYYENTERPYICQCRKCFTRTGGYPTKAEAIQAWNRAMGNRMESQTVVRTAKVESKLRRIGCSDQVITVTACSNCENVVSIFGDLISREDAINTALEFFVEFLDGAFHEDDQKILMKRMNALPSAEPEEGEWIMHKMLSRDYGKIYYQHDCSCNLYESPYPFCPNCGMKMKRGDR